ncbi:hypothetical protein QSJ19_03115 [Gordonia sp. ABSL11-1]|uniref:hypothetical protein n=1 Tax=Gordonia sp. ABSL11-1 TaxID=3053924 RepID=UPI00257349F3|nr:hypothetical protein [Gordonia sp. ABSL11-1]MDL9944590.1 hypothetical protein [Gordonia sp. ABSL11-1]
MGESGDITWLANAKGEIALGVRRIDDDGDHALELLGADGQILALVRREDAARLVEKLQTGITFTDLVGDPSFSLDLGDL